MRKRLPLADILRPFATGIILLCILGFMLGFRLDSLVQGYSQAEIDTFHAAQAADFTPRAILENSLYFPYKASLYLLQRFDLLSLTTMRAFSAVCGMVGVAAFYFILRKWHTKRMALIGGLLFAASTVWLQASRVAGPEALYLLLPLLLALGIKLEEGTRRISVAVLSVIVVTQLLYLPGMVWLLGGGLIWQRQRIVARLREINTAAVVFMAVLTVVLLIPLGLSLATNTVFWQEWLAYPLQDQTLGRFIRNLVTLPWHVFFRDVPAPEFHVGRLPVLDAATSIFVLLGVYWYWFQRKLDRTKLIAAGLAFGGLMTAATGLRAQVIMMPFIYLLATGGATLLLQQWFTVFPRNPLARSTGLAILLFIVGLISFFHLQRYFIAWPNAPETKQVYSLRSDTIEQ